MYNETVTIFNRKHSRKGDSWYPTVLEGVNLNMDRATIQKQYGEGAQDLALLNIRLPAKKPWKPPKEWAALDDPATAITFASGEQFDFFWLGEWPDEEQINDDDYEEGFYNFMNAEHDFVFSVSSVNGPFSVIPHLEVTGK